jgi:hypothetical protein
VLEEVRETRDAVRALPPRDAPASFWSDVLGSDATVVELAAARHRRARTPARWAALAAGAAAAVIVGVALVPSEDRVEPAVAAFTDAHAVRASVGNDAVSTLAGQRPPQVFRARQARSHWASVGSRRAAHSQ